MATEWNHGPGETPQTTSDASSVVSSSSTLIGEVAPKLASFQPARPHRRAISALALGRNAPVLATSQSSQILPMIANTAVTSPVSGMPFLMRSNSNPSLPSFKAKESRLPRPEGTHAISVDELRSLLLYEPAENLLILDVRPFVEFSRSTIQTAQHVCLPSTLLRRKTFTLERLIENLPEDVRSTLKAKVLDPGDCSNVKVVVFDNTPQTQSDNSVSASCHGMASKFANNDKWNPGTTGPTIHVLNPGFPAFEEFEPTMIISPLITPSSSSPSPSSLIESPKRLDSTSHVGPKSRFSSHSISTLSPCSIPESPVSSSSPVSGLLKFQLPVSTGTVPTFKIARNEEVSNLESYLSAVNIGEKQRNAKASLTSPFGEIDPSSQSRNTTFKFPTEPSVDITPINGRDFAAFDNKLNFQKSFLGLKDLYVRDTIDSVVPKWFQDLANESKIDMVAQFQKIDLLEKKRLSYCLSNSGQSLKSHTSSAACAGNNTFIHTNQCAATWFDEYNSDEEDQNICISSGVELGAKNRYKDIFPYEHTRVVLKKETPHFQFRYSNEIWDTYINANYLVNPFVKLQNSAGNSCMNVRYIATQAPLAATIYDFYTCILNNNVPLILSLTDEFENGVEKCHKFWAEGDYDGIQIKLLDEYHIETPELDPEVGPVTLRRIQIHHDGGQIFETLQAQVKNWPDLGVMVNPRPILDIIRLKNLVIGQLFEKQVYSSDYLPTILVHCSAGCGRTGTLCALDTVLSNASKLDNLKEEWVGRRLSNERNPWSPRPTTCLDSKLFDPVIITINKFRKQRISMVQNVNQYLFIYDCLLAHFEMCLKANTTHNKDSNIFSHINNGLGIVKSFLETKIGEAAKIGGGQN
ncbi:LANO_0B06524g1_1 [Lachancea nothofagi CBS 11611]|uniref:protein-tyrosine-phosphatase n=1 Tax=Lachancea nothofagi CBS 11611 TaxID=1266666 RepID=A0A1G4IZ17_9SACH|nr:LANO_0B06524g1_1 [Lachancea nothofagi CBS 11611]